MKSYYYKFKGNPYAYGPFPSANEKAARSCIRSMWNLNTLHGCEVWEA